MCCCFVCWILTPHTSHFAIKYFNGDLLIWRACYFLRDHINKSVCQPFLWLTARRKEKAVKQAFVFNKLYSLLSTKYNTLFGLHIFIDWFLLKIRYQSSLIFSTIFAHIDCLLGLSLEANIKVRWFRWRVLGRNRDSDAQCAGKYWWWTELRMLCQVRPL